MGPFPVAGHIILIHHWTKPAEKTLLGQLGFGVEENFEMWSPAALSILTKIQRMVAPCPNVLSLQPIVAVNQLLAT